ncbi:YceI family protein [Maricaulis maris]|uniref:Polyisoprenoid-binding protein YceI n=1 Tax=Maricaulis maris TaxID=74318 RepID=A0A495D2Z9_9PROT|nr:YceI family protein [Maricaulis maris]RKQ95149.1 polyisoprenoid-binding protein YceI [Maricaulis maris]
MLRTTLLALSGLALMAPTALAQDWTVDHAASSVAFETTVSGGAVTGAFDTWAAAITLDPADLENARIEASVSTASGSTGNRQMDDSMLSNAGLNPTDFETARFVSDDIRATDTGYEAHGILTIRGSDQPLVMPFTLDITDGRAVADSHFVIARTDFGVGGSSWGSAAAEIAMVLHIEADAAD